jgi:hypothetical protein
MVSGGHADTVAVKAVTIVFTALAVVSTSLRLFTRLGLARNAGLDDAFISFATILTVGQTVTVFYELHYGVGRHQSTISLPNTMAYLKALYASIVIYNVALLCVKYSVSPRACRCNACDADNEAIRYCYNICAYFHSRNFESPATHLWQSYLSMRLGHSGAPSSFASQSRASGM